mgnify:FL=1
MASFEIVAGDFSSSLGYFDSSSLTIDGKWTSKANVKDFQLASNDDVKTFKGALGWGAVGTALAGPFGLAAGAILGGKKKEYMFIMRFKDGKKLLGKTNKKNFNKLWAMFF